MINDALNSAAESGVIIVPPGNYSFKSNAEMARSFDIYAAKQKQLLLEKREFINYLNKILINGEESKT